METVNLKELEEALKELMIHLTATRNLICDGKEVQADRKMQGAIKRCGNILQYIMELNQNDVVNSSDQKVNENGSNSE